MDSYLPITFITEIPADGRLPVLFNRWAEDSGEEVYGLVSVLSDDREQDAGI